MMRFVRKRASLRVVLFVIGVSAVGCSSLTGPSGPRISISFAVQPPSASSGVLGVNVDGTDVSLSAPNGPSQRSEINLKAREFGTLPVHVVLMSGTADTLASVAFSQTFERGNTHWIGSVVSRARPLGFCIGTVAAVPLRSASSDSLFVMYGSIPEGAIC